MRTPCPALFNDTLDEAPITLMEHNTLSLRHVSSRCWMRDEKAKTRRDHDATFKNLRSNQLERTLVLPGLSRPR